MLNKFTRWISRPPPDKSPCTEHPPLAEKPTTSEQPYNDNEFNDVQHRHSFTGGNSNRLRFPSVSGRDSGSTNSGDDKSLSSLSFGSWPIPPSVVRVSSLSNIHQSRVDECISQPPTNIVVSTASADPEHFLPNLQDISEPPRYARPSRLEHFPHISNICGPFNDYQFAKQLSPIEEQDSISPSSLDQGMVSESSVRPSGSNPSIGSVASNISQNLDPIRPFPRSNIPTDFTISNKLGSRASSSISHPSLNSKITRENNSKARGSVAYIEEDNEELAAYKGDDMESLHAESFLAESESGEHKNVDAESLSIVAVPASPWQASLNSRSQGLPLVNDALLGQSTRAARETTFSTASESFIRRRWEHDASFGSGMVTFRVKRQWIWITHTPAFWAFWLGFLCPFLWLVGGWHFTRCGEQPPKLTWWEFFFWKGRWRTRIQRLWQNHSGTGKHGPQDASQSPKLPRWVTEKQSSDNGRMRLNDPKRSLRGISFGYPFIPRTMERTVQLKWRARVVKYIANTLERPNRMLDQVYGVRLREVSGRPESGRRMFDPWIQRCRYAFCYAFLLLCIALCVASAYLIVSNTSG